MLDAFTYLLRQNLCKYNQLRPTCKKALITLKTYSINLIISVPIGKAPLKKKYDKMWGTWKNAWYKNEHITFMFILSFEHTYLLVLTQALKFIYVCIYT